MSIRSRKTYSEALLVLKGGPLQKELSYSSSSCDNNGHIAIDGDLRKCFFENVQSPESFGVILPSFSVPLFGFFYFICSLGINLVRLPSLQCHHELIHVSQKPLFLPLFPSHVPKSSTSAQKQYPLLLEELHTQSVTILTYLTI